MSEINIKIIQEKCSQDNLKKLEALNNPAVMEFIAEHLELCNPDSVFVRTDSEADAEYIRNKALELKEELPLATPGHTIHFDGYNDQARDKKNTKFLVDENTQLSRGINQVAKEEGLKEVKSYLKDLMKGKEAYICFYCLGPNNSEFSIAAVQITDSSYVAHSEALLYRNGYEEFMRLKNKDNFFKFVHSAGVLVNGVSRDIDKRRVYIDLSNNIVYSTNTQYGGNTIGLKKLAMRLAIKKASNEGWLTEHMFVMATCANDGRKTYFTGAFPSACGKTSTSMLKGEKIVGDDIAYLRKIDGVVKAVNVERGMFGIIKDVNSQDDPLIWEALNNPGEIIFSNVLLTSENIPYWLGKDGQVPQEGINYSGKWHLGKKDDANNEITPSHKNARYTIKLAKLGNLDDKADAPEGVKVDGVIYGGRDSNTSVPVEEAFDWRQGILTKASTLESETTAATLGEEGVRVFNPMSNLDFLSIPLGRYIENNIKFAEGLDNVPKIFSVNYFLKDQEGKYISGMHDKHVWLKWMELRVHNEAEAIKTPSGYIPLYEDLKKLFKEVLGKEYTQAVYDEQFKIRIPENIAKIDRIIVIYKEQVDDTPKEMIKELELQRARFFKLADKLGDYIIPGVLKGNQNLV
jgi:phosphoenolpyruvate carboxykinase (GTP)